MYWPIDQKLGGAIFVVDKSILSKFSRGTKEEYTLSKKIIRILFRVIINYENIA